MKKVLTIALAAILILAAAGCGSNETKQLAEPAEFSYDWNVSYANWTDIGSVFESALNRDKATDSSSRHLPVFKFDTVEDLELFKKEFSGILTMDLGYGEIPSFNDTVASYNEEFFKDNALLLVYVEADSGSFRYGVRETEHDNDSVCIRVEQLNQPEIMTMDMAGWFITVAVSGGSIESCADFDAELIRD